jgi:predicted alpha-1,6-mannanase (GH76 family)
MNNLESGVVGMQASVWQERAEAAQQQFNKLYWNPELQIMNQWYPVDNSGNYYYWWQAHAIDVLVDGYIRSDDVSYVEQILKLMNGAAAYNGGTLLHNYYDDMEWMALALLRAYEATLNRKFVDAVNLLWSDIKTAWNDHMGGGMAWRKDQLDYKNTPANAPAAILAARLYQRFGNEEDLSWATKIYEWNKANLVDPSTGFVWDGINRLGDSQIDYDWKFTYCQGVFIGAGIELFYCTGDISYLEDAKRTALITQQTFIDPRTGMLPDEGLDDTALFKGILIRYVVILLKLNPDLQEFIEMIRVNAEKMWHQGKDTNHRFSTSWIEAPTTATQLSVQLSAMMLLEAAAALEAEGMIAAAEVTPV